MALPKVIERVPKIQFHQYSKTGVLFNFPVELTQNQLYFRNLCLNQILALSSSSVGKFNLKNAKNLQKNLMLEGLPFPEKLLEQFRSYISYFCDQDVYVVKISGDLGNFSRSWGVKTSERFQNDQKVDQLAQIWPL